MTPILLMLDLMWSILKLKLANNFVDVAEGNWEMFRHRSLHYRRRHRLLQRRRLNRFIGHRVRSGTDIGDRVSRIRHKRRYSLSLHLRDLAIYFLLRYACPTAHGLLLWLTKQGRI